MSRHSGDGAALYRFTGTTGSGCFFDFARTNGGYAQFNLYGPQFQPSGRPNLNVYGIAASLNTDFEVKLPPTDLNFMVGNTTDYERDRIFSVPGRDAEQRRHALTLGATVTARGTRRERRPLHVHRHGTGQRFTTMRWTLTAIPFTSSDQPDGRSR